VRVLMTRNIQRIRDAVQAPEYGIPAQQGCARALRSRCSTRDQMHAEVRTGADAAAWRVDSGSDLSSAFATPQKLSTSVRSTLYTQSLRVRSSW